MKKIIAVLCAVALSMVAVFAQTPEEILERMEKEVARGDAEGMYMYTVMKMPLIGKVPAACYSRGDKMRLEVTIGKIKTIEWEDKTTNWTYISSENEITISKKEPEAMSDAEENVEMMEGIAEGYDLTLIKETDSAWYILCTKKKTNKEKDDPKKIDLVVSKTSYLPLSFSIKIQGVSLEIKNVSIGVSEAKVTFNRNEFPNAKIIDKR